MGCPREFLNVPALMVPFAQQHGLIGLGGEVFFDRYIDMITSTFASANGVFGTKLLFDQFEPYLASSTVRSWLTDSKFIWLVRRDVVAQAVSQYIAAATEGWTAKAEAEYQAREGVSRRKQVSFDREAIEAWVNRLSGANMRWLNFFAVNEFDFLLVTYENLLEDPNLVCQQVCAFCGIQTKYDFRLDRSTFIRQSDERNWVFGDEFRRQSPLQISAQTDSGEASFVVQGVTLAETPTANHVGGRTDDHRKSGGSLKTGLSDG